MTGSRVFNDALILRGIDVSYMDIVHAVADNGSDG